MELEVLGGSPRPSLRAARRLIVAVGALLLAGCDAPEQPRSAPNPAPVDPSELDTETSIAREEPIQNGSGQHDAGERVELVPLDPDASPATRARTPLELRGRDGSVTAITDPDHRLPFALVEHFAPDRRLTHADVDVIGLAETADGTLWMLDRFGPSLIPVGSDGVVSAAPAALPDRAGSGVLRSASSPGLEEASTVRILDAMRSHAEANGSDHTSEFTIWHLLIDDGDEATAASSRDDPPDGLARASSEIVDVGRLHAAGHGAIAYTINEPDRMAEVLALGVSGLISDRPDLLHRAIAEFDASMLLPDGRVDPERLDAQGHRGARDLRPENTLPSMEAALDHLMNTLETDIAVTADGVPVLQHDPIIDGERCRRVDGDDVDDPLILTLTFEEVRSEFVCDLVGHSDVQSNDLSLSPVSVAFAEENALPDPYSMPSLPELFRFVDFYERYYRSGPGAATVDAAVRADNAATVRFNIEAKINPLPEFADRTVGPDQFVDAIAGPIIDADLDARSTLQSFDWRTLLITHERYPTIRALPSIGDFLTEGHNLRDGPDGETPWLAGMAWPYRSTLLDHEIAVIDAAAAALTVDSNGTALLVDLIVDGAPYRYRHDTAG